jgi:DNA modification methylase
MARERAKTKAQPKWPADKVERRSIESLIPYASNARSHSDEQVAQIAASMKEWGWTNPVLIDETGMIIAGHGRVLAARKLGISEAPVMVAEDWTEAQKKAYVLADNQLALNAGWNTDLLSIELKGLQDLGFDLDLIGFGDLASLLSDKTLGLTDPDEVPETPADPVTVPGDVWVMGKHRIICGDSTDADCVAKVLAGVEPHLMVTDPPYGVEYDPAWHVKAAAAGQIKGAGKRGSVGKVMNDDRVARSEAWALFPGDVAYVWHAGMFGAEVAGSLAVCGFEMRSQIIWAKSSFAISRGHYHWQHETCWYAVKKGGTGHWAGDRSQSTIWKIDKQTSDSGHGTQKPVECMKRPIENNSSPGQAVYEPFSGSGTTIIAGEMTGRSIYAIELNPAYVDVAVKRWQDFTGNAATLEGDGRTFAELEAERLGQ